MSAPGAAHAGESEDDFDDEEFYEAQDVLSRQTSDAAPGGAELDHEAQRTPGPALETSVVIKDLDSGREFVLDASGGSSGGQAGGSPGAGAGAGAGAGEGEGGPAATPSSPPSPVVRDEEGRQLSLHEFSQKLGITSPVLREVEKREAAAAAAAAGARGTAEAPEKGKAEGGKAGWKSWFKKKERAVRSVPRPSLVDPEAIAQAVREAERDASSDSARTLRRDASRQQEQRSQQRRAVEVTPEARTGLNPGHKPVRAKVFVHRKLYKELTDVRLAQELRSHEGAVWCMQFSHDGQYMASAGQDAMVRIWEVSSRDATPSAAAEGSEGGLAADGAGSGGLGAAQTEGAGGGDSDGPSSGGANGGGHREQRQLLFNEKPLRVWKGHKGDVLDISWSSTLFLLSASMDKTVRLWHISMDECLRVFVHNDFVTSVDFDPADDKYFLSGSLDEKLRVWNIPDHCVADFVDLHEMITAVAYAPGGDKAVVGSYKGTCRFYRMEAHKFEYVTQIDVRNARANPNATGKKITGLSFMPGDSQKLLVTSNDSRLRVYDGYTLVCKYKGLQNVNSQIRASFSEEGDFIVCGSEDECAYVWSTVNSFVPSINPIYTGYRKDKHASFECFLAHQHIVSVAIFAPRKHSCVRPTAAASTEELVSAAQPPAGTSARKLQSQKVINAEARAAAAAGVAAVAAAAAVGRVIISAGYSGEIKVFQNFGLPSWI